MYNSVLKMKSSKILLLALAVSALFVASCHKDKDDETTSKSFSGTIAFDLPVYVSPGDSYTLTPKGLKDTVDIGYYWTASPLYTKNDTTRFLGDDSSVTGAYVFNVKDTLCQVSLKCVAFATGYYTSSSTFTCVIVSDNSITGDGIDRSTPRLVDTRDGTLCYYETIDTLDWFVRNLSYKEDGHSYYGCDAMDDVYGKYYTWNEAQNACPDGWHLPSNEEWLALANHAGYKGTDAAADFTSVAGNLMVNASFNGDRMWEYWPAVNITNSTNFSAIPTGYGVWNGTTFAFSGDLEYAAFWTSDESSDGNKGIYRYMYVESPTLYAAQADKDNFVANVRCVRKATGSGGGGEVPLE